VVWITRPPKRERLIAAAAKLVDRHGIDTPTLAQIARAANVAPGNVYYYFKTREELLAALVNHRRGEVRALLSELDHPDPRARLKGLAETWAASADHVAENGCTLGCLASQLGKTHPSLAPTAAALMEELLEWSETQFRQLGRPDARDLATMLLGGIQGAALLAGVLQDPDLMRREVQRLDRWIDELC